METTIKRQTSMNGTGLAPYSTWPHLEHDGIVVAFVTITPALAEQWIAKNNNIRSETETHIKRMARDMRAQEWDLNGESIKFNTEGDLIDGQNRLHACIEAQHSFASLVMWGIESDENVDTGQTRRFWQQLERLGYPKMQKEIAASVRILCRYRKGCKFNNTNTSMNPTPSEMIELLRREPKIVDSVDATLTAQIKKLIPNSYASVLHYLFSEKDKPLAEQFFQSLSGKIPLAPDDPVALLRERLTENRAAKSKLSHPYLAALAIKAWGNWRTGTKTKILKWAECGPTAQEYPEII